MAAIDAHCRVIGDSWVHPDIEHPTDAAHVIHRLDELQSAAAPPERPARVLLAPDTKIDAVDTIQNRLDFVSIDFLKFRDGRLYDCAQLAGASSVWQRYSRRRAYFARSIRGTDPMRLHIRFNAAQSSAGSMAELRCTFTGQCGEIRSAASPPLGWTTAENSCSRKMENPSRPFQNGNLAALGMALSACWISGAARCLSAASAGDTQKTLRGNQNKEIEP
jgi:hypothetical protein